MGADGGKGRHRVGWGALELWCRPQTNRTGQIGPRCYIRAGLVSDQGIEERPHEFLSRFRSGVMTDVTVDFGRATLTGSRVRSYAARSTRPNNRDRTGAAMYGYDRLSQIIRDPNLRASDAEREATADRLRQHHIDGRLDQDEFQARLDRCFAAKTVGELAGLMRDLPPDPAWRGSGTGTNFGLLECLRMIPIVPIILTILAIHLVVGAISGLWILIPLFFLARLTIFRCGFRAWSGRRGAAL
jgi:DUF1707 SHOCT-like domain